MVLTAKPDSDPAKPNDNLRKAEKAADEELRNFLKNGPPEAELQIAKTQIFGNYARIVERIGGFCAHTGPFARRPALPRHPHCAQGYLDNPAAPPPAPPT